MIKCAIKNVMKRLGLRVMRGSDWDAWYESDGLHSVHNHDFLKEPTFQAALARGLKSDENLGFMTWRLHVALWAAKHASALPGDFVECGVNRGFLSSAVMKHLDWNRLNRTFFLFDTFQGIATELLCEVEVEAGRLEHNKQYTECYEATVRNFAEFERVKLVKGVVPESLSEVEIERVAYLSIDMNCAHADTEAFEYFWPRLSSGAVVLIDDYAYNGFESTYVAFNKLAAQYRIPILSLPTGQGVIIKA